jgi:hypothetical protein
VDSSELPCSFSAFVAGRRGISVGDAEQLIAHWLEAYEPRARHTPPRSSEGDHDPYSLRIPA